LSNEVRKSAYLMLVVAILAGCAGQVNGDRVPVRDGDKVKARTEKMSSQILDIMALDAEVTESGALAAPCSGSSSSDIYRAQHPWSAYGVPVAHLKEAMDRLREELPVQGWKITKDGSDGSSARTPQIVANSSDGEFSADIRLLEEPPTSDHISLIEVTVVSACYQAL
jgi:hypothetical protein